MIAWWSRILSWRRERLVPYVPREPAAIVDWSNITATEEGRKALGEAFRRLHGGGRANVGGLLGEDGSPVCTCTIDSRCAWCSESDSAALARVRALEARLWEAIDGRAMPVSAVCHSIANDLRITLAGDDHQPTPPDLDTGTRGEYAQWVIETKLGRRLAVCVDRSPYPEDARQQLEALRTEHPGLTFRAVRETTARTEEDW